MNTGAKNPQAAAMAAPQSAHPEWTADRNTVLYVAALILPLAVSIYQSAGAILPLLAGSLIIAAGWTMLFARLRRQNIDWHCTVTATLFALMVPPSIPLWQALLALSFGIVVGEQIFGGRGYGFLSAPVTALAFLLFSFPGSMNIADSGLVALSVIPGALVLLTVGLISWRISVGFAIGLLGVAAIGGFATPLHLVLTSSLALGVFFLVCDPVSAASTNVGRWVYGVLAGGLAVILAGPGGDAGTIAAIVFATLLAGIFAPLIDRVVIIININRRRRRNG